MAYLVNVLSFGSDVISEISLHLNQAFCEIIRFDFSDMSVLKPELSYFVIKYSLFRLDQCVTEEILLKKLKKENEC